MDMVMGQTGQSGDSMSVVKCNQLSSVGGLNSEAFRQEVPQARSVRLQFALEKPPVHCVLG